MSRFNTVDGVDIPLTDTENAARDAEELAFTERLAAEALAATTRDLSPSEFNGLLNLTELDEVWDALRADLKGKSDATSRATRFLLGANRDKTSFNLERTLALVAQFRPKAALIDPTVDLSDGVIQAAWVEVVQLSNAAKESNNG